MSMPWLLFACLSVLGSLTYTASGKYATSMHPFVFAGILSLVALIGQVTNILLARYGFGVDIVQGISRQTILLAMAAGLGAVMVDVGYFFALRFGSPVATMAFWTVGGLTLLTIFSVLFFKEIMTPTKIIGIVLGLASLFLLSRQT